MKNLFTLGLLLISVLTFSQQAQEVFKVVDEMPRFPGCELTEGTISEKQECAQHAMLQYIYQNLKYPAQARDNKIQGTVVIQFIVDTDGSIDEAKIVRDIGGGCGEAALAVVQNMNSLNAQDTVITFNDITYEETVKVVSNNIKWRPGYQRGEAVKVLYTLPVKYKLTDDVVEEAASEPTKEPINVVEETTLVSTEELFKVVEEMPRFPGCEFTEGTVLEKQECAKHEMLQYIYKNLKYPAQAREGEIEGIVVIQFIVDTDGSIDDAKIVRDIGGGCGHAALKVVEDMNNMMTEDTIIVFDDATYEETVEIHANDIKWRPGYQDGKAVKVLYTLPVKYKLDAKEIKEAHNEHIHEQEPPYAQELYPELVRKAYAADPVEASKIVGEIVPYGRTMHPILQQMASHSGIDFRAVPGVKVSAAGNGKVIFAGDSGTKYGNHIIIQHDERTKSLYAHLSEITVKEGQQIQIGDLLGAVGQSGRASYPHLHLEVHIDNQAVNPRVEQKTITAPESPRTDKRIATIKTHGKTLPLYVIDGVRQEEGFDIELSTLSTDKIETINIYKGEKAKEKFGEGTENGVVDIVLKKETQLQNPQFELEQNRPNPVSGETIIGFHLPTHQQAALHFYNAIGEHVYSITDGMQAGYNEVTVRRDQLKTTGIIYYFLVQGNLTQTKKMVVN